MKNMSQQFLKPKIWHYKRAALLLQLSPDFQLEVKLCYDLQVSTSTRKLAQKAKEAAETLKR